MNWDAWLLGHRLAKAVGTLVVLIGGIIFWELNDPGPVQSQLTQPARIIEVFEKAYTVELIDGSRAKVFRIGNHAVGQTLIVDVTTYQNQERNVTLSESNAQ